MEDPLKRLEGWREYATAIWRHPDGYHGCSAAAEGGIG